MTRGPAVPRLDYEGITRKAERGEYTLVDPLDYEILDQLPNEGETFAGLYPIGEASRSIAQKLIKAHPEAKSVLTPSFIATRLRVIHVQKLVCSPAGTTSSHTIWQRTKTGTEVLNKWKEANGRVGG